jgi:hypothetical protein
MTNIKLPLHTIDYCENCEDEVRFQRPNKKSPWFCSQCGTTLECEGHPAGPYDPAGETVYCDGTCR